MIKLKTLLSESYAWERQEGKSLPTLAEVQAAYDAKMREEAKPDFLDLDDDGDEEAPMKQAAKDADDAVDTDLDDKNHKYTKLKDVPKPYKYDPYGDEDDDDEYNMYEAAKPDFLDLDGDGDETESMKSAAADSTPHGNYISKARAKSHLTKKDDHVYGIDGSGKGHKITNASDLDKYNKFTIKSINENSDMNSGYQYLPIGTKVEFQGKTGTIQDHVSYRHGDVYYKIDYDSGDDEIVVPRDTRLKKLGESKQTMKESFWKRVNGNLHGHEHILREAFKRK